MLHALAADAVLVLHLGFIAFASGGALLVVWRARIAWLHLPALAWAAWIVASHGICPLTPLENSLRHAAGEAGYAGGFIDHYLVPLIYPPGLTPAHQNWIALALVAGNVLLYGFALFRHRRRRASQRDRS
jgi:hypothetical protein